MPSNDILTGLVEHIDLDDEFAAEALLNVEFPDQDIDRMHELIERRDDLSDAEREELAIYMLLDEFLRLLHVKASGRVA